MNWRNGKFMSKAKPVQQSIFGKVFTVGGQCAPASATVVSTQEMWVLVDGKAFGVQNAVAFRSAADGTYLGANAPGDDTGCGGEVAAISNAPPPQNDGTWPGWWVLEPAMPPLPAGTFGIRWEGQSSSPVHRS
jgi:hypothetical protein